MPTPSQTFDTRLTAFKEVQEAPWGRLRYTVAAENLKRCVARHLEAKKLIILDVGGGNRKVKIHHRFHGLHGYKKENSVLVNSSMNTRKKGVFGGLHPQTHLFFGNLVVHTFVDEYTKKKTP